jgi:hypothetical protein
MSVIMLRPDLKTTGGEVSDIMCNGEFIGTFTVVYRESDRLSGAIQLEQHSLSASEKQEVLTFMEGHVQFLIDALRIEQCEVLVTYSAFDQIIATPETASYQDASQYLDEDLEWVEDESRFDDIGPDVRDEMGMEQDELQYELVVMNENRSGIEYHIYDKDSELVAEAAVKIYGTDIVGEVTWSFDPFEEEMDLVTELLVEDCDEDNIDTIILHMKVDGEIIETIELTHMDLLNEDWDDEENYELGADEDEDYTVVLARDDQDTLTYEIYQQSLGGLPIGTATVDISQRQLSGFIDFREPGSSEEREQIATLLLDELDKEKDYETLNISMLYRNKLIDEICFETEHLH